MIYVRSAFAWLGDGAHWSGSTGIAVRLGQHLLATALVVVIAALIAVPVGVAIGHTRRGAGIIGAIAGAARSVPTLGLLTLFALGLGIGLRAPLLALIILAIPSLLAGAYAGVQAVDPATSDAARAVGMNEMRIVTQVELPLGAPVLIGGVRAATLQVVSTATLMAYAADWGLGRYLFTGLKTRDYGQMLGGAVLVIAVALVLELTLGFAQRRVAARLPHAPGGADR